LARLRFAVAGDLPTLLDWRRYAPIACSKPPLHRRERGPPARRRSLEIAALRRAIRDWRPYKPLTPIHHAGEDRGQVKLSPDGSDRNVGRKKSMRMGEMLAATARRVPQRVALCFEERCWTFAELDALATQVAAGLARAGVRPGERVAFFMPNCPE